MGEFGILTHMDKRGTSRYAADGRNAWDLAEAEEIAFGLLGFSLIQHVAFGDGDHEFRIWNVGADRGNFGHNGRWAEWYVDVEINGHRWTYLPVADMETWEIAEEFADRIWPVREVTRMWIGASDGSQEFYSGPDDK